MATLTADFSGGQTFGAAFSGETTFGAAFKSGQTFGASLQENRTLGANFDDNAENITAGFGSSQVISTGDYEELANKPKINSVEVIGAKAASDYNLQNKMDVLSVQEIERILYL